MRKLARSDIADHLYAPLQQAPPQARPHLPSSGQAAETARYIADLVAEMESMAGTAKLEMLAYFLALARMEAETAARTPLPLGETVTR